MFKNKKISSKKREKQNLDFFLFFFSFSMQNIIVILYKPALWVAQKQNEKENKRLSINATCVAIEQTSNHISLCLKSPDLLENQSVSRYVCAKSHPFRSRYYLL